MTSPSRRFSTAAIVGLLLVALTVTLIVFLQLRLRAGPPLPKIAQVVNFTLTNQFGSAVSLADLRGEVWVADIIFTRCPGPCARMTRQMKELETALPRGSGTRLVSLTTDPDFDSPEILRQYAERFGADSNRWMFLTGSKTEIARAAIDGLKLTAIEKAPEERESVDDLFIHSTIFVVVDRHGVLRGVFETGDVEWSVSKQRLLDAVRKLERER
ncbi:MAG TPA: SCO family protein [Verrucomicrobiae bacterium]|nr:SCO family protein [Verrucomicrobiae bacterium]